MALQDLIDGLRQEEKQALKRLQGIRAAISSLADGNGSADLRGRIRPRTSAAEAPRRRKRRLSAKARKAISDAQKARWAKVKRAAQASK